MKSEPSPFAVGSGAGRVNRLRLEREDWQGEAALTALPASDYADWEPRAEQVLSQPELAYFHRVVVERRRQSFLLGRVAARLALSELGAVPVAPRCQGWQRMEVVAGVFQQPVLAGDIPAGYGVSIAHAAELAVAVAFPAVHPMAVDVETVGEGRELAVTSLLTPEEKSMARDAAGSETELHFALWSAREALSKVLHCGLVCSPEVLAVKEITVNAGQVAGTFRHFPQYRFVGDFADGLVRCLVTPRKTSLSLGLAVSRELKNSNERV